MAIKHGKHESPVYNAWHGMKQRCLNPNNPRYKDYGGRGIKIHDAWLEFVDFYKDMGDCPVGRLLDRIDNNGNYEPNNCRWATPREQQNNMRSNKMITFNGIRQTTTQWARDLDINPSTLFKRLNRSKWTVERALSIHV
jgi:hypothetical protein